MFRDVTKIYQSLYKSFSLITENLNIVIEKITKIWLLKKYLKRIKLVKMILKSDV